MSKKLPTNKIEHPCVSAKLGGKDRMFLRAAYSRLLPEPLTDERIEEIAMAARRLRNIANATLLPNDVAMTVTESIRIILEADRMN